MEVALSLKPKLADAAARLLDLAEQDARDHRLSAIEASHALIGAAAIATADAIASAASARGEPIGLSEYQALVTTFDKSLAAQLVVSHAGELSHDCRLGIGWAKGTA